MTFTVKIKPSTRNDQTTYDLHVYDGQGAGGEEQLVFSNQGYENRKDAVALAVRLFGSPAQIAEHFGQGVIPAAEPAVLEVYGVRYNDPESVLYRKALR